MLGVMSSQAGAPRGHSEKWTRAAMMKDGENALNGLFSGGQGASSSVNRMMEEEAVSEIQRRTKKVQADSLASSERALRRVVDSEKLAGDNMDTLRVNSEQLSRVECRLDNTAIQVKVSESKADHLKSLNRFFMLPSFGGKRAKKHEKIIEKNKNQMQKRNDERVNQSYARGEALSRAVTAESEPLNQNKLAFNTTPAGFERDQTEVQIDSNLAGISRGLGRLKAMGQAMSNELDTQNKQIQNISSMAAKTDTEIKGTNKKVYKLMTK